jgi:septum formation protein
MLLPILDKLNSMRIVLASASTPRRTILESTGLKFDISASTFAEDLPHSDFETSRDYVIKTSETKLHHKLEEFRKEGRQVDIIITADTIMSLDEKKIIEKPEDKDHAYKILKELTDRESHQVYTSVWIGFVNPESMELTKLENIVDRTTVFFQKLDDETIWAYIESGEPFGKAGGYGIQGKAATLVKKIEGDYYSVWGFPLSAFCMKIKDMMFE